MTKVELIRQLEELLDDIEIYRSKEKKCKQ